MHEISGRTTTLAQNEGYSGDFLNDGGNNFILEDDK